MEGNTVGYELNEERMNAVLKKLRTTVKWNDIMEAYENYLPKYNKKILDDLNVDDLREFNKVFYFKSNTIQGCKSELHRFLNDFWKHFASTTIEGVCENMERYRDIHNEENPKQKRLFVNWIPKLGGVLTPRPVDPEIAQRNYMREASIEYPLTGEVPPDDPYNPRYGGQN
jgi:hypothetical protein